MKRISKITAWKAMLKQLIICQNIEEKNQLLDRIILAKGPRVLSFLNAHAANLVWTEKSFRKTLLNSDYLLRDGSGIHLFLSLLKISPGLNLNGTDLIPEILDKMKKDSRIAVYGTKGEYLKKGVAAIKKKGFNNITSENGFHNEAYYLEQYQTQKPDLVILAMGMPKQENISISLRNATNEDNNVLIINGGGIIDFISEKVPRSPEFMRQMGIEWLFRLVRDPLRLWKRNLGSILFLIRAFFFSRNM